MGSQKLDAPNIEYIANNDTHPGAQFSEQFHTIVKTELARISALDNVQTAQAKPFKPSQLAKLSPPKDGKTTTLAFANPDPPKHEQAKHEPPKSAQAKVEQTRFEQHEQQNREQRPSVVFADTPKPQPVFSDAFLTSANAGNLFVQRTLTISDMKEYVKRAYPNSQTADLSR
jgi:hypothetical protein